MATRTVTHISDDLDGSTEDVETVRFALHGAQYEIDLTKTHQDQLTAALEPFLNVARKAGGTTPRRTTSTRTSSSNGGGSNGSGVDAKAVRAWAASNNIDVPPRGRIPNTLIEQYHTAGH